MHSNPSLISTLKSSIPEASWSWVIPALKHDAVIWQSLNDPELFEIAAKKISEPRDWSPNYLAAICLDSSDLKSVDKKTLKAAEGALDDFLADKGKPRQDGMSLKLAAQISVGIFNRYEDNYQLLIEEILGPQTDPSNWETPFSIYLGFIPDQLDFLIALICRSQKTNLIPMAVHAILCQPIPTQELTNQLQRLLSETSLHETTLLLNSLNKFRPDLTFQLANERLLNQQDDPIFGTTEFPEEELFQLTDLLHFADIYTLARQTEKADSIKSQSLNIINGIQAKITNELVRETLLSENNVEQSLSLWTSIANPPKLTPPASLIIDLLQSDRLEDSLAILPELEGSSQTPIRWLTNIHQALNNEDISQARLFANQALNAFIEIYEFNPESLEQFFGSHHDALVYLSELIHQLINLASYKEAYQAAVLASQIQPDDPEALIMVTKTGRSAGEYEKSIEAAELATAITPTNPEYRRQLAQSLEGAGYWSTSLVERRAILEHRFAQPSSPSWPLLDDLLALANCSIHADQPQQALDVCQKAIDLDPSNGQAHALLGEALTSIGDIDQALEHFDLATQLAPHKPAPWLSLAKAHQRAGQFEKSIETLRTASHAVPDDPSLFYALGQVYIKENSPSQAQSAFARAYQLVTEPNFIPTRKNLAKGNGKGIDKFNHSREQLCEIALSYGQVLEKLGHAEEANQVFRKAYQAYPSFPGLAYSYAKSIMEVGDEKSALAPLAIAVAAEPADPQPYIEYARVLLKAGENPDEAVFSLHKALEILKNQESSSGEDNSEDQELATALLAQAQEAAGEIENALLTYSQALETDLGRGDIWRTELAVGMGRVALQLDQPEVAIAALQVTDREEIQNTQVAQILCEAYSAISLTQEALFAARTAVHLAPDDVEVLSWFADQAGELGVIAEAIPALTRGAQLAPKRTDLIIRLGLVYIKMGKGEGAKDAFLSALSSPYSTPEDLYQAADGLSELGDDESAAACLERALELQPYPPIALILELANTYTEAGKTELAIKTIDKGVDQDPENALLHTYKAGLLSRLDRLDAAQACLEHALILDSENPYVHFQIAHVLRDQGNLICAFDHAQIASETLKSDLYSLPAQGLVAELARSNIVEDVILENQDSSPPTGTNGEPQLQQIIGKPSLLDYYCIVAEIALEREEQVAAAAALNDAFLLDSQHPRVLALQSRMAIRQGDRESALKSLDTAIVHIKDPDHKKITDNIQPNSLLGIARSAIELYRWDLAYELLESAASISPKDANVHLQRARLFVERAEFQRLCEYLDIVNHAPGESALSPRSHRIFEDALQESINCLPEDLQAEKPAPINRWSLRGEVAFHPDTKTISSIEIASLEPSDSAALLLAVARTGDSSASAQLYHSIQSKADSETLHHCIYAAYAMALCSTGKDQIALEQAMDAIHSALDHNTTEAIYYVIQAKIAERLGDWQVALTAMKTALTLWSNEPRWQSYLGQLSRLNDDFAEAIIHFNRAIEMEPKFLQHYFDLSQAHLANGEAGEAILVLRKSLRIAPDHIEPYLALANAQYENRDYAQAMKNAQLAAKMAPDEQTPLLLSARIALKMSDPGKAKTFAESALRVDPDSPEALHLQAQALSASGQAERALNIVDKAIPLSSDPLPLLLQRASLISQFEGSEAHLKALKSIAEEYPDEPLVLAPLAEALAASGQNPEAIQSAQQALHRSSGQLPLDEQAHLHNLLGALLQQSGQLDQSIHHLSEAIRIAPSSMESYLTLGETLTERRQYEQALETYQKAIRLHPSDPRPYYQAGLLLKASRDYPAAEKMLRKAAAKAPDDVAIHRQLAALVALNLVHNRQPVSSEV